MKTPTDEEMNVAICEWLGWEVLKEGYGAFEWGWFNEASHNPPKCLPNHVTGIEALAHLHEAEKRLKAEEGEDIKYRELLIEVMSSKDGCYPEPWIWHATSRQRAKALCRIIKPSLFE